VSWAIAAANAATVSYALTVSSDFVIAGVFALNAFSCIIITMLIAVRRIERFRSGRAGRSVYIDR
jgi:hypothetical protein